MSQDKELGELKSVDADEYFENEENGFTPWVVENIDKLAEIINLELKIVEQEANIGTLLRSTLLM